MKFYLKSIAVLCGLFLLFIFLQPAQAVSRPLGGVQAVADTVIKTTDDRLSDLSDVVAGLSISVASDDSLSISDKDNTVADQVLKGRQLNGALTKNELTDLRTELKNKLDTKSSSINVEFAVEDVINFNCPNGFKINNVNGAISVAQIKNLIDGNCGL